ncbi:MAG: aminotransferase class V-fold PLP-dependent enzyme [Dehalococcoidia bacterium]|nr:aminotransferase class V-fold PLP-dependent enzyme [Dehalococcoidia bacterium]
MIYLDNAATSYPKPESVYQAMEGFMRHAAASPGRSGHRLSIEAGRVVYGAREALAQLFNVDDPLRIVFTKNATEALNLAINGILRPGDHAITSSMEHNSVMRPLRALEKKGIDLTVVGCSREGFLDPQEVEKVIRSNTRLIVLTHASNVVGTLLPVAEVGAIARKHKVLFCVDAAQTAGAYSVDINQMNIDLLAFTGHKSLFGPQGTGGLCIGDGVAETLEPLMRGGTGSRSESEHQPGFLPDKYESGTPNTVGLAGLSAGVAFILSQGVARIREREEKIIKHLIEELKSIPEVTLYGTSDATKQMAVISLNIDGFTSSEVAVRLEEDSDIMCRPGLQCAPVAHKTLGTFPDGTVRLSPGYFTTEEEIGVTLEAIRRIAASE